MQCFIVEGIMSMSFAQITKELETWLYLKANSLVHWLEMLEVFQSHSVQWPSIVIVVIKKYIFDCFMSIYQWRELQLFMAFYFLGLNVYRKSDRCSRQLKYRSNTSPATSQVTSMEFLKSQKHHGHSLRKTTINPNFEGVKPS